MIQERNKGIDRFVIVGGSRTYAVLVAAFLTAATSLMPVSASVIKNIVGILPRGTDDFSGEIETTLMSGYLGTSGAIFDTRPNLSHCLSLRYDLTENLFLDGYAWIISSLHTMQKEDHRALFHEFEGAVRIGYDYYVATDMKLQTKAGLLWNPPIGYDGADMNCWGPYVAQYLENKYLIPYWDGLWLAEPTRHARIRMGVRKPFRITENLSLTPFIETVWLDRRRFLSRYKEEPLDRGMFGGVFGSITSGVSFRYRLGDDLTLYGSFSQFDIINSQARRSVRRSKNYWAKCDWPVFKLGISYCF